MVRCGLTGIGQVSKDNAEKHRCREISCNEALEEGRRNRQGRELAEFAADSLTVYSDVIALVFLKGLFPIFVVNAAACGPIMPPFQTIATGVVS
jgi:hypothetical protein